MTSLRLVALAGMLVAVSALPRPENPQLESAPAKAVFGSTFDEVVVHTQLEVRPKPTGTGVRGGRAKPVFFRPNATSGAETRRIKLAEGTIPSTSTETTSTTTDNGIIPAARVVGVENPLAVKNRPKRQFGFGGSASNSASETFYLPTGGSFSGSFSNGFNFGGPGARPSASNAFSVSYTDPQGEKHPLFG